MPYTSVITSPTGSKFRVTFDQEPTQEDIDFALRDLAERESNTGQSLASSAGMAAVRGAAEIVPSVIEGFGAITGDSSYRDKGQMMRQSIREALPVNPVYEQTLPVRGAESLGISLASSLWVVPLSVLIWRRVGRKAPGWLKGLTRWKKITALVIGLLALGWLLLPAPPKPVPITIQGWTIESSMAPQ